MTDTSKSMKVRNLGRTDIKVTPIGLGAWQFSAGQGVNAFIWPTLSNEVTNEIVKTALDGGINWFDTAEFYGKGRSEQALARALKAVNKSTGDIVIATKWSPFFRTARSIKKTIGERLRCLEGFSIDLHQVHQPTSFSSIEAEMEVMADLVESGKIRAVGVSNFSEKQMRRAHKALALRGLSLASNQVKYNLLDRHIERNGVLDTAKELGITIIAFSPLEMGLLTGKFHDNPDLFLNVPLLRRILLRNKFQKSRSLIKILKAISVKHDVTSAQVALNWLINFHDNSMVAIPGATKASHVKQNAGAMSFELSDQEIVQIDELSSQFR